MFWTLSPKLPEGVMPIAVTSFLWTEDHMNSRIRPYQRPIYCSINILFPIIFSVGYFKNK